MKKPNIRQQIPIALGDGLTLRWATPADNEQLVELAFHALDEDDSEYPFVKIFAQDWADGKFPLLGHEDITVVEDESTGKIVSSMCLFSETWRYGNSPFKIGRPEMVMTHADYRRRGLVRKQFEIIHAFSAERGEVMQVITGIPSLYRFFGYQMSLTLGGGYRIYPPSFPKLKDEIKDEYRLRTPKSETDRNFIKNLHTANTREMLFSMDVPDDVWEFEFDSYTDGSDGKFEWLIIENKAGEPLGYVMHQHVLLGTGDECQFLGAQTGGWLSQSAAAPAPWSCGRSPSANLWMTLSTNPPNEVQGLYLRLGSEHPDL